jgi:alkylation response protein AidB-like acyl-CoA dehydrogenase
MDIPLQDSEEQRMLRDSVRRWVKPIDVRHAAPFRETWSQVAAMGWLAAGLPEAVGGLDGSARELCVIAEELGRGLLRVPFVDAVSLSAQVLLAVGPQRLAALASGDELTLIAHDEPQSRGDPAWIRTVATPAGSRDTWQLTGIKSAVLGAAQAHALICTAEVPGSGLSFFELSHPDSALREYQTFDDRPAGDLHLQGAQARLIGPSGEALPIMQRALDFALVIESAEAVGAMQRAFELTRNYLLERRQYGQRIGDFQVLRHRLADMFIELEQARSIVLRGLAALTQDHPRLRSAMAAATKARVAQAGLYVSAQAVQLHGGIGMAQEHAVGHYFNRLVAFNLRHGTADVHLARFASLNRGN